jgi:hypothetical protein
MAINLKNIFQKGQTFLKKYPWIISLLIVLIAYWQVPLTYFEQDEWQAFETYINTGNQPLTVCLDVQRPLTCVINTLEWRAFGTHAFAYGISSLALILLITFVFYRLLRRLNIPVVHATVAAGLFPLFTAGSQAITWFGAFSASLPSFLFAILAIDYFHQYVHKPAIKLMFLTLICLLVSLYFKEETLWLGPVFLAVWVLYRGRSQGLTSMIKSFIVRLGPPAVIGVIYLALERLRQLNTPAFSTLVSTTDSHAYLIDVVKAIFLLPLTHLSQVILSPDYTVNIANAWNLTIPLFSLYLTIALFVYLCYILIQADKKDRPAVIVLLVWTLTGFISYAIFGKNPELLEGRYYFGAQAPLITLLVVGLLPTRFKTMSSLRAFGVALLIVIVGINLSILKVRLHNSFKTASERKAVIGFIQKTAPTLPPKAIIYTETTNYGYVGQAAFIMPFQNGLGTTLRVLYQGKDQDYRALSKKQAYLWNLLNQGYDEVHGVGFGYFREYQSMLKSVKEHRLPVENVYAFRYVGTTMSDISSSIRSRLTADLQGIVPVTHDSWQISTSNDAGIDSIHGVDKLLDTNPKSDWSVPHAAGASVSVNMGKPIDNLTQIALTTADGNSFPRIVKVELSKDGQTWEGYDDIGTIDLDMRTVFSFPPQSVQAFRVTIIDQRPMFFNWSVSDVNAYTLKRVE